MEPIVNENEKIQPTYEELAQAYQQLLHQAQELEKRHQALLYDKMIEKLKAICSILEHRDFYSSEVISLADWHIEQLLAKPVKPE